MKLTACLKNVTIKTMVTEFIFQKKKKKTELNFKLWTNSELKLLTWQLIVAWTM